MADRRRSRGAAAGLVLAFAVGVGPVAPTSAQSVTPSELQALAQRAVDDPRALALLRGVREVDGLPVDVGQVLAGAEGAALTSRLRASPAPGSSRHRCPAPSPASWARSAVG